MNLDPLKNVVISKGMQLLQSPAVNKVLESEAVGMAMEKALSVPIKISGALTEQKERLVALFELATQEDIDGLKRNLHRVEQTLREIKDASQELVKETGGDKKKNTKISD